MTDAPTNHDQDREQASGEALLHTSATASDYDDDKTFDLEKWRECSIDEDR